MKGFLNRAAAVLLFLFMLPQTAAAARLLVPVGEVIGISLEDDTVTVAAFDEALGSNAWNAGLRVGDRLLRIDDTQITSTEDVHTALTQSDGIVDLEILRSGKSKRMKLQPEITEAGPKLGIYLKQGITGVGTVTWYDPESGAFGALGHGVNTQEGTLVRMHRGTVYPASVVSVKKGLPGTPGQLMGTMESSRPMGTLTKNTEQGIFGTSSKAFQGVCMPAAEAEQIQTGPAYIRSTVLGQEVQEYSVEILKIYPASRNDGRNMLLKVTDPELLEATGGIVQGMSGSPLVQDGKLIGAVTHVLVNDPTMGYGIFIENMLDAAG